MTSAGDDAKDLSSRVPFEVSRAFTFFFDDPAWIPKLAVGSLFAFLTPFVIGWVFVVGYAVGVARRAHEAKTPVLPEWEDFQEIFLDGLRGLGVTLAHQLPLVLLSLLMFLALIGGVFLGRAEGALPEKFMFLGLPALVAGFVAVLGLSLFLIVYLPAALVRFVQTDSVAAAFDVAANFALIRTHLATYVFSLLAIVLSAFIAQLGFLVFCVGVFPAAFWAACVTGFVVGELAALGDASAVAGERVG
jgi:Protein of unknown function (DUF4013)